MELVATVTRKQGDPPLSRSLVRMIGREFTTDDGDARRDLGYVGTTSREAGRRMYVDAAAGKPKVSAAAWASRAFDDDTKFQ